MLSFAVDKLKKETQRLTAQCQIFDRVTFNSEVGSIKRKIRDFVSTYGADIQFAKVESEYDAAERKAREHDTKVERVFSEIDAFDYDVFVENPIKNNYLQLMRFEPLYDEISQWWRMGAKARTFESKFSELKENFQELLRQYNFREETYRKLAEVKSTSDLFFDKATGTCWLATIQEGLDQTNKSTKVYYDFPTIKEFREAMRQCNERYIASRLGDELLDDINGHSLSQEQRRAVVCEDDNNLVIAAAGSGKTLTICGRVRYLLERLKVSPKDILVMSFSRRSVEDVEKKLLKLSPNIEVRTFNALGLAILNHDRPNSEKCEVEEQFKRCIERFFSEELRKDSETLREIVSYFAYYSSSIDTQNKRYKDIGELYSELQENTQEKKYKTLKKGLKKLSDTGTRIQTIEGEYVKSYEELVIANYLFLNGVSYEYERKYEHDTKKFGKKQYSPDFYLPDYGLYWEHYALNSEGKTPQFEPEAAQEYERSLYWKRQLHQENGTTCLETYSYYFSEGTIFAKIDEMLKRYGVEYKPVPPQELYEKIEDIIEGNSFKHFKKLVESFLNLYKAKYRDERMFDEFRNYKFANEYERKRAHSFLGICKKIYLYYRASLRYRTAENPNGNQLIDFDDMILGAMEKLPSIDAFRFRYIIVDEFQDISFSRMEFLRALVNHGNAKLFAVGDDWQSIYRFAGSDIDIFVNFRKYFGAHRTNLLTETYRNSNELLSRASTFIMKNNRQIKKQVHSDSHCKDPVRVRYYRDDSKASELLTVMKDIYKRQSNASVFVLGRNNYDIESYLPEKKCKYSEKTGAITFVDMPTLNVTFKTAHGSKGLEADYVVIINAEDARTGFPNKMEDDSLLSLVLADAEPFPFAEERRLFYVALTRTRNVCYILAHAARPSVFVKEILDQCVVENPPPKKTEQFCPLCKSGKLILKNGRNGGFYGCSHYPMCEYNRRVSQIAEPVLVQANKTVAARTEQCPHCGAALRLVKNGQGLGCPNWGKTCKGFYKPIEYKSNIPTDLPW